MGCVCIHSYLAPKADYLRLQVIYIMERNIRKFDISSPLQAFQFATFLLRLRARSDAFVAEFDDKYAAGFAKSLLDPTGPLRKCAMCDSSAVTQQDPAVEQGEVKTSMRVHQSPSIPVTPPLNAVCETPEETVVEDLRVRLESVDIGLQNRARPDRSEAN